MGCISSEGPGSSDIEVALGRNHQVERGSIRALEQRQVDSWMPSSQPQRRAEPKVFLYHLYPQHEDVAY